MLRAEVLTAQLRSGGAACVGYASGYAVALAEAGGRCARRIPQSVLNFRGLCVHRETHLIITVRTVRYPERKRGQQRRKRNERTSFAYTPPLGLRYHARSGYCKVRKAVMPRVMCLMPTLLGINV